MELISLLSVFKLDSCEVHIIVENVKANIYTQEPFLPEIPISINTAETLV